MTEKMQKLIRILYEAEDRMNARDLAICLEISERSVRQEIADYMDSNHDHAIDIISDPNGYSLDTRLSQEELEDYLKRNEEGKTSVEALILRNLLLSQGYLKIEDLADELYLSESTVSRFLRQIKRKLKEYHLSMDSKPGKGIRIEGNEVQKRICLAHIYSGVVDQDVELLMKQCNITKQDYHFIFDTVHTALFEYDCELTEVGIRNLLIHLIYAVVRIRNGSTIDKMLEAGDIAENERQASEYIAKEMEKYFDIQFCPEEISYIGIHLLSKRFNLNPLEHHISEETEILINEINKKINDLTLMDFANDSQLYYALAVHLESMLSRIHYGIRVPNPMLSRIKMEFHDAFECAVIAAKCIKDSLNETTSDEELAYLALHYNLAISRLKMPEESKRFVLVCSSGMGTALMLKQKIMDQFHVGNDNIILCSVQGLQKMNLTNVDYVLSTVRIPYQIDHEVFYIENLVSADTRLKEMKSLSMDSIIDDRLVFIHPDLSNKEEVLHYLCEKVGDRYHLSESIEGSVLQREKMSSTDIGNFVAIPHPEKMCTENTIFATCILKKAVSWGRRKAKYVFLISYSRNSVEIGHQINEIIMPLFMNPKWVSQLDKVTDASSFRKLFR